MTIPHPAIPDGEGREEELSLSLGSPAARSEHSLPSVGRPEAQSELEPVAWRCKDYADGWLHFQQESAAAAYQAETGCLMEPLYAAPASPVSETFHQRWMRLSRTRDYAGALALLRTPIPAESSAVVRPSEASGVRLSSTAELNPPPTGEGWRPIETAPINEIVVVTNGEQAAVSALEPTDYGTHYWALEGDDGLDWQPTHWMPLPQPPAKER